MRRPIALLWVLAACDATVETQGGGGEGHPGGGANNGGAPQADSCEDYCDYVHSTGCANCSCNGSPPSPECLELAKETWSCSMKNLNPELCNDEAKCADLLEKSNACEQMHGPD